MPYLLTSASSCSSFSSLDRNRPDAELLDAVHRAGDRRVPAGDGQRLLADGHVLDDRRQHLPPGPGAGKTAINYVEGATAGCSASGNAAKHIPTLYLWGADDRSACAANTRPYSEFDPNHLPNFAFVTPTLCNDGHDCSNATVDAWARANVQPVLDSAAYQAGQVAVFIWYDEDAPVPNLADRAHRQRPVRSHQPVTVCLDAARRGNPCSASPASPTPARPST